MSQINRTGTFRGFAIDSGMGETKNGYPQWVAQLQAIECYDEDTEQWVDWSEYEEKEITGYFVLFGGDGNPTLTAKQIQKALGWSGESFQDLCADFSEAPIQFRIEESTYQGETRLKVTWIDDANAEPGRTIQKLDSAEVKKLDSKYAAALRKLSGGPKPKSVPSKPPVPKPEIPAPASDKEAAKAALKEQAAERAKRGKIAEEKAAKREKPKGRPAKPPIPTAKAPESESEPKSEPDVNVCTKNEAYQSCYAELVEPGTVTLDQLNNTWLTTIEEQGGEETLDGEGWAAVRNIVLDELREVPI